MANHPNRHLVKRFKPPKPSAVRMAREKSGMTQTEAAELVHTTIRSWQQWEAEEGSNDYRRIPGSAWELFLIKTGQKKANDTLT